MRELARPLGACCSGATKHFVVLRAALAEDRGVLPHIRDIHHALALRRDPALRSLRKMLAEFHASVQRGDADLLVAARREVAKAKRAMARRRKWQHGMDWLSYLSVPVAVAEAVTGIPPIAGVSLGILGATGTAVSSRVSRRHEWVMFNV